MTQLHNTNPNSCCKSCMCKLTPFCSRASSSDCKTSARILSYIIAVVVVAKYRLLQHRNSVAEHPTAVIKERLG